MTTWMFTILLSVVTVSIAMIGLAIGWLITGNSRVRLGMCGKDPREKTEGCGTSILCSLCKKDN